MQMYENQRISEKENNGLETLQFKLKWLGIGHGQYKQKSYQYVYRPTTEQAKQKTQKKGIDGVQIVPIIQYQSHQQLVFIANFRPAMGKFVVQFPAGLAEGESMLQNAKRQLQEQSGLIAYKIVQMPCPMIYADPNKGNQSGVFYIALINGQDQSSFVPFRREVTQNIRCYSMKYQKKKGVCHRLQQFVKQNDYVCDAKTWLVCMGLDLVERLKNQQINIFQS